MTRSTVPSRSGSAALKSPGCRLTRPAVCGAAAQQRAMFRSVHWRASGSPSTACTRALGTSCAMASAIAPVPVPRSATTGSATSISVSRSSAHPVMTSVSGRGTKTPGPTSRSRYLKYAVPVMCCSGSRASRRATSSQNLGSKSPSATRLSWLLVTPCRCAAISSASARGDSTPASASRVTATAISVISKLIGWPSSPGGGELVRPVGLDQRADDRVQVPVEHLVQVVGLEADPVVGDPVLRVVVGPDPLRPVHGRDLAAALGRRLRVGLLLGGGQQPGAQDAQRRLLVLQLALLVLAGHHDAARQVGDPDRGVGRVHALAAGTGRAEDIDPQVVRVDADLDRVSLWHHHHTRRRRVDPALRLGDRDALHPVHAALVLQQRPGSV